MSQGIPVAAHLRFARQNCPSLELGFGRGGRRQQFCSHWALRRHGDHPILLYPVHLRSRKSLGEIIRKLSVTESHISAHLLGTSLRRKTRVTWANSPQVS